MVIYFLKSDWFVLIQDVKDNLSYSFVNEQHLEERKEESGGFGHLCFRFFDNVWPFHGSLIVLALFFSAQVILFNYNNLF